MEVSLGPFHKALSKNLPTADRDLGLHDLVSLVRGIRFRIKKCFDPSALIILEKKFPENKSTKGPQRSQDTNRGYAQFEEQEHGNIDDYQHQCRTEIRLDKDKNKRKKGEYTRLDDIVRVELIGPEELKEGEKLMKGLKLWLGKTSAACLYLAKKFAAIMGEGKVATVFYDAGWKYYSELPCSSYIPLGRPETARTDELRGRAMFCRGP